MHFLRSRRAVGLLALHFPIEIFTFWPPILRHTLGAFSAKSPWQGRTMRDGVIIDCGRHEARVCHFTPSNSIVLNNVVRSDDIMVDYDHDSGPMTEHMTIVSSLGWITVAS